MLVRYLALCQALYATVVASQRVVTNGQGLAEGVQELSNGSSGVLLLGNPFISLRNVTFGAAQPGGPAPQFGTLTIQPAPNLTQPAVLDTAMRAGLTTLTFGPPRLELTNVTLINVCELVYFKPGGRRGTTVAILGLFALSRERQLQTYTNVVTYGRQADITASLYTVLADKTSFARVHDLTSFLLSDLVVIRTRVLRVTSYGYVISGFDVPATRTYNFTFKSMRNPTDPLLQSLRSAGTLMAPAYCNGTLLSAELVDGDVDPLFAPVWLVSSSVEVASALTKAAALSRVQAQQEPPPAVYITESVVLDQLVAPVRIARILWLMGPVNDEPSVAVEAVVDLALGVGLLALEDEHTQLFVQQMTLSGLAATAVTGAQPSVFPLAIVSSPSPAASWPSAPYLWLHNVTMMLPTSDYLALLSLVLPPSDPRMGRALQEGGVAALAAQLRPGVSQLVAGPADPHLQWFSVDLLTGWGMNATSLTLRPVTPGGVLGLSDSSGGSSSPDTSLILACVLGTALPLLVLLAAALAWAVYERRARHAMSHTSKEQWGAPDRSRYSSGFSATNTLVDPTKLPSRPGSNPTLTTIPVARQSSRTAGLPASHTDTSLGYATATSAHTGSGDSAMPGSGGKPGSGNKPGSGDKPGSGSKASVSGWPVPTGRSACSDRSGATNLAIEGEGAGGALACDGDPEGGGSAGLQGPSNSLAAFVRHATLVHTSQLGIRSTDGPSQQPYSSEDGPAGPGQEGVAPEAPGSDPIPARLPSAPPDAPSQAITSKQHGPHFCPNTSDVECPCAAPSDRGCFGSLHSVFESGRRKARPSPGTTSGGGSPGSSTLMAWNPSGGERACEGVRDGAGTYDSQQQPASDARLGSGGMTGTLAVTASAGDPGVATYHESPVLEQRCAGGAAEPTVNPTGSPGQGGAASRVTQQPASASTPLDKGQTSRQGTQSLSNEEQGLGCLEDQEQGNQAHASDRPSANSGASRPSSQALGNPEHPCDTVSKLAARLSGAALGHSDVDKIQIKKVLGKGSWGIVYAGMWRGLPVALKTMVFTNEEELPTGLHLTPPILMDPDQHTPTPTPEAGAGAGGAPAGAGGPPLVKTARAVMEVAIAASVSHKNLVATYCYDIVRLSTRGSMPHVPGQLQITEEFPQAESSSANGQPNKLYKMILCQELCGSTLETVLAHGALRLPGTRTTDWRLALPLLLDIASGLEYLHSNRIIHADLKPANVLLKPDSSAPTGVVAKLSDFGLSAHMSPTATHVSNFSSGSPFYVAPEVVLEYRLSTASDMYSFGILLWQVWTSFTPYVLNADGRTYSLSPVFPRYPAHDPPPQLYQDLTTLCLCREVLMRPKAADIIHLLKNM